MVDQIVEAEGAAPVGETVSSNEDMLKMLDSGTNEDAPVVKEAIPEAPEATEEEPEVPVVEESKTQLWAKMAQQDKELRQLRTQLKGTSTIDQLREIARKDPGKVLADLGMGIDQVIDALAQQGTQPQPQQKQEQAPENNEVALLRKELEEFKQAQQSATQEQMVRAELGRIDDALRTNPDRWEVIASQKDEGSYRLVLETASELWKQSAELVEERTVPDYDMVLDAVEEHLSAKIEEKLKKLNTIKKLQKVQQSNSATPAQKIAQKAQGKVLNPNTPTGMQRPMTEEEKLQHVLNMLNSGVEE